ncbi:hypothetical protein ACIHFC_32995 [Streptomyces sp. NPDC052013]|uniref:hypothetical protein n=1 Tax=Streptomyces sp. NPDC052013 TaxID=3365679 RepID=UPI0037CE4E32
MSGHCSSSSRICGSTASTIEPSRARRYFSGSLPAMAQQTVFLAIPILESERIVPDTAHIGVGTLRLADRGPWGLLARWHRLRERGIHLLWRITRRKARRVHDVLPDGSYLAGSRRTNHSKATGTPGHASVLVRVIEYRVDGRPDIVRLTISLTDHEKYPATEPAALYADAGRSSWSS